MREGSIKFPIASQSTRVVVATVLTPYVTLGLGRDEHRLES